MRNWPVALAVERVSNDGDVNDPVKMGVATSHKNKSPQNDNVNMGVVKRNNKCHRAVCGVRDRPPT